MARKHIVLYCLLIFVDFILHLHAGKLVEYFWNTLEISLKQQLQRTVYPLQVMLILTPTENTVQASIFSERKTSYK